MKNRWLAGVCLFAWIGAVQANPESTYQWMLSRQIIASAQSEGGGVATVVIGANFYNGDATSRQTLCGTLLVYLRQEDPTVQGFSLVDGNGNAVGSYDGKLTLNTP